ELHPRGRKLAALVHADHDAARALLIEASVLYDKFHKRLRRWTLRSACSLPYAAREHAKDFTVEQLAHHLVFVARVDVRVDVDLDEIDAVLDLLEIGAVQAAADEVGGPHSRADHPLGCLADGHRFGLAFDQ